MICHYETQTCRRHHIGEKILYLKISLFYELRKKYTKKEMNKKYRYTKPVFNKESGTLW